MGEHRDAQGGPARARVRHGRRRRRRSRRSSPARRTSRSGSPTACSKKGVFCPAIVFPTVAKGSARVRTIVTADHTDADLHRGAGDLRARGPGAGAGLAARCANRLFNPCSIRSSPKSNCSSRSQSAMYGIAAARQGRSCGRGAGRARRRSARDRVRRTSSWRSIITKPMDVAAERVEHLHHVGVGHAHAAQHLEGLLHGAEGLDRDRGPGASRP